jgi:hypothetical protein
MPMPSDETMREITDRWSLAIGRFLVAFGEIERMTLEFLRVFPRDPIFESTAHLPLGRRIALVRDIVEGRTDLARHGEAFLQLLKHAEQLLPLRNVVAHNPFVFGVYEQPGSEGIRLRDELVSFRNESRRYSFPEIRDSADEAHSIAMDLVSAFYELQRSSR